MSCVTRRELLERLGAGLVSTGAVLATASCTPATRATDSTEDTENTEDTEDTEPPVPPWCGVEAGPESEGWRSFPLSDNPALAAVGGAIAVRIDGQLVNIAQVEEGCFVAMGTVCTHEGCTVEVRDNPGPRFVCPCHGALFGWDGIPIAGPAPDPLPTWPAGLRDGAVWVHLEPPEG